MNLMFENKFTKILLIFVVILVVVFGTFYLFKVEQNNNTYTLAKEKINYFDNVVVEAKSAFVWDVRNQKVLFAKNEEAQLPLASITKLMTAFVSSGLVPENTIITINDEDLAIEGENGFSVGEKWTLKNILDFTLLASSNDGAHALASVIGFVNSSAEKKRAEEMFVEKMNAEAQKMGLAQTFFLNESGLDLNEKISGAYGSARDAAILMENILNEKPEILEATKYSQLDIPSKGVIYSVENTNQDVEIIPGIIGSKTGFTDLAGGNLVIAFDVGIGRPIIVSVLGSSKEGRFEDVKKLVNASINTIGLSFN